MTDQPVYYVISDLHIGGDEQLEHVEFLEELIALLEQLEATDEQAELIINGDAFGLWEFTNTEGPAKFDQLVERYPALFKQLAATGEQIPITLIPGNHDYELATEQAYVDRFAAYNVTVVQAESITRPLAGRTIYFEHGHQRDPNNRIEEFGLPNARPLGYYFNTHVTSRAGKLSDRGRFNWLKDIQAVTPTERIPSWLLSKYFYREMHPALRYSLLPVLLLFNISVGLVIMTGLDLLGVWSVPLTTAGTVFDQLGIAGAAIQLILTINIIIVTLVLLVAIPGYLIVQDFKRTVDRFGIFETSLTVNPQSPYTAAARELFDEHPDTAVFCYGHTHRPSLTAIDGRAVVNTGTWLKRLHRRDVIAGILPPVFYPSYQPCVVRIAAVDQTSASTGRIRVAFDWIEKADPSAEELTLTERLLTLGRAPTQELPDQMIVAPPDDDASQSSYGEDQRVSS